MTTTTETNPAEATKEVVGDTTEKKESVASPKKEAAPPKPSVHKQDFEKDVVYLYQFPRTPTIASVSAFCLKVETYLRVAGIKYEVSIREEKRVVCQSPIQCNNTFTNLMFFSNMIIAL